MHQPPKAHATVDLGQCPICDSAAVHIHTTRKPRRFFRCRTCGATWEGLMVLSNIQRSATTQNSRRDTNQSLNPTDEP